MMMTLRIHRRWRLPVAALELGFVEYCTAGAATDSRMHHSDPSWKSHVRYCVPSLLVQRQELDSLPTPQPENVAFNMHGRRKSESEITVPPALRLSCNIGLRFAAGDDLTPRRAAARYQAFASPRGPSDLSKSSSKHTHEARRRAKGPPTQIIAYRSCVSHLLSLTNGHLLFKECVYHVWGKYARGFSTSYCGHAYFELCFNQGAQKSETSVAASTCRQMTLQAARKACLPDVNSL
jgi:hypothetical protein